ncbi:hypothetical protein [Nitrobacter hamburgensis]|uniref:hypothetical protein n=1 Tax=Nitrobacter hamburgensis TaxID=912 RepID=UPI0012EE0507|nr:hypothetical protein [Nitrobacter hamburgensis]
MRILTNAGNDRVIDQLRAWLTSGAATVDLMSPDFSLHAFAEAREVLGKVAAGRLARSRRRAQQGVSALSLREQ